MVVVRSCHAMLQGVSGRQQSATDLQLRAPHQGAVAGPLGEADAPPECRWKAVKAYANGDGEFEGQEKSELQIDIAGHVKTIYR